MRTNWCTGVRPPMVAWFSTSTCPARLTALARTRCRGCGSCGRCARRPSAGCCCRPGSAPLRRWPGGWCSIRGYRCCRRSRGRSSRRANFLSWGSQPMAAPWKNRLLRPMVGRPSIRTDVPTTQSGPMTTSGPITEWGPILTLCPRRAEGCTTAVGWISGCADGSRTDDLVDLHRVQDIPPYGWSAQLSTTVDMRSASATFSSPTQAVPCILQMGPRSLSISSSKRSWSPGSHRLPEAGVVDPAEVHQFALGVLDAAQQQNAAGLGHGLDDQHRRHDGVAREMPLEEGLVDGHVLDARRPACPVPDR